MEFFSSFEESDPAPTWTDTVDTDDDGNPRADGATLRTRVGGGPASAYTAKTGVGFTGVRSLRYQGSHTAAGPASVVNKIFWVEQEVEADTELSYLIFPELTNQNLRYPSTYVAIDLAFDDGSYLSELGAVDQLGFELSPRGQGESKALYADQWNRRAVRLGEVAAGKTITKILLGYDFPHGRPSPDFAGWIDDIAIAARPVEPRERPSDYVITTRGTHSNGTFSRGNCFPATAVPHGFNFWTPITNAYVTNWFYEYHRANNDRNRPALQAFGVSHLPSPWMGDRHTFHVMPTAQEGRIRPCPRRRALSFQHANEIARPHYYSVTFDNGIRTEIAPTDHAAMFRFTFPGKEAGLIFDNVNCHGRLRLDRTAGTLSGYSDVRSGLSAGAGRMFVYATFDRRVRDGGRLWRWRLLSRRVTGFLRFTQDNDRPAEVTMRIATSLISVEQAKRNLALEIAEDDTFEDVRERAQSQWDELLERIEVEGATEDQLSTLYSNLYRLFLYPNAGHENTGTVTRPEPYYASPFSPRIGPDTPTTSMAKLVPGQVYVNNGFWDTYRTCWPAYALLTPTRCGELIDGFVQHYRDGGWISRWSSPGYANLMTGTSSDVAFADAYLKGVTNFDVHGAYDAALRNATTVAPNASVGRKGLDPAIFFHYTPTSTAEGLSWTLEGCVNDFGIANLAKALGDEDNHGYFLDRARHYVNAFDQSIGFFQGRDADYSWRNPPAHYDPRVWGYDYVETNGWNTAFSVPHDGQGLANLYGGREALAAKLDAFFASTGWLVGSYRKVIHEMTEARDVRMGQYGHSNQPSHHIIYMYAYAGIPSRIQEKVREVLSRTYSGSEIGQGYCGDEDNGEMSAWWLLSALGIYPLQVGSPYYIIGSPLFTRARVRMDNGHTLVVNARNNSPRNIYVQSLKVNGERYDKCYLPHRVLASGAVLDFLMGPEPSRWGSGPDAAPPSITAGDEVPLPLHDITGSRTGTATWSGGSDPGPVFDDTGREATFATPSLWIRYSLRDSRATVLRYTITSGSKAGDPKSWVLEGSNDGHTWTTVDERASEEFRWRRQTRAFPVTSPGEFGHYRLRITDNSGERTVTIAEIELLAR